MAYHLPCRWAGRLCPCTTDWGGALTENADNAFGAGDAEFIVVPHDVSIKSLSANGGAHTVVGAGRPTASGALTVASSAALTLSGNKGLEAASANVAANGTLILNGSTQSFRHVRLALTRRRYPTNTKNGVLNGNGLAISEFRLTLGGEPVAWDGATLNAPLAGSLYPGNQPQCAPSMIMDGTVATSSKWFWATDDATNLDCFITFDFDAGEGKAFTFDGYQLAMADVRYRHPTAWSVYGSDDGVTWTALDTRTYTDAEVQTVATNTWLDTYTFSGSTDCSARFVRWVITAINEDKNPDSVALAEFQLLRDGEPVSWGRSDIANLVTSSHTQAYGQGYNHADENVVDGVTYTPTAANLVNGQLVIQTAAPSQATGRSISLNVANGTNTYTANLSGDTAYGLVPVPGKNWVNLFDANASVANAVRAVKGAATETRAYDTLLGADTALGTPVSVTFSANNAWTAGTSAAMSTLFHTYLDDCMPGADGSPAAQVATIAVKDVPFARYDVIVYFSTGSQWKIDATGGLREDSSLGRMGFSPVTVNGETYSWRNGTLVSGEAAKGLAFGESLQHAPELGVNALRIPNLSGDLLVQGGPRNREVLADGRVIHSGRGTIAAIQIVDVSPSISVNMVGGVNNTPEKAGPIQGIVGNSGLLSVPNARWNDFFTASLSGLVDSTGTATAATVETDIASGAYGSYQNSTQNGYPAAITDRGAKYGVMAQGYREACANTELRLRDIPYPRYDLILYLGTDKSDKQWNPVKVTTAAGGVTYYSYPAGSTDQAATASKTDPGLWGDTENGFVAADMGLGKDAMLIRNLSDDDIVDIEEHGPVPCFSGALTTALGTEFRLPWVQNATLKLAGSLPNVSAQLDPVAFANIAGVYTETGLCYLGSDGNVFWSSSIHDRPVVWTGAAGDGDWNNPDNWYGGRRPNATYPSTVLVSVKDGEETFIDIPDGVTIKDLTVVGRGDSGKVTINGKPTINSGKVTVEGKVTIDGSAFVEEAIAIDGDVTLGAGVRPLPVITKGDTADPYGTVIIQPTLKGGPVTLPAGSGTTLPDGAQIVIEDAEGNHVATVGGALAEDTLTAGFAVMNPLPGGGDVSDAVKDAIVEDAMGNGITGPFDVALTPNGKPAGNLDGATLEEALDIFEDLTPTVTEDAEGNKTLTYAFWFGIARFTLENGTWKVTAQAMDANAENKPAALAAGCAYTLRTNLPGASTPKVTAVDEANRGQGLVVLSVENAPALSSAEGLACEIDLFIEAPQATPAE